MGQQAQETAIKPEPTAERFSKNAWDS